MNLRLLALGIAVCGASRSFAPPLSSQCGTAIRDPRLILLRVGIDQTFGGTNAPGRQRDGRYLYVPIPERRPEDFRRGLRTSYDDLAVHGFDVASFAGTATHLDPDFAHLTYGDHGSKAQQIVRHLLPGDFIAFYGAFRDVESGELVYALFGSFEIESMVTPQAVPPERWGENAHTRRTPEGFEIIVRGKRETSGRFARFLPIGSFRKGAYRVRPALLREWGGLSAKDGFLQRSAGLLFVGDVVRFRQWLQRQAPELLHDNFSKAPRADGED